MDWNTPDFSPLCARWLEYFARGSPMIGVHPQMVNSLSHHREGSQMRWVTFRKCSEILFIHMIGVKLKAGGKNGPGKHLPMMVLIKKNQCKLSWMGLWKRNLSSANCAKQTILCSGQLTFWKFATFLRSDQIEIYLYSSRVEINQKWRV